MPELEQLGVGVLEQLQSGRRAFGGVVEEGRGPSHHQQVGVVVGHARLEDLGALGGGERGRLAAHDLRDLAAEALDQRGGVEQLAAGAGGRAHVDDEVVLGEALRVGAGQGRGRPLQVAFHHFDGARFQAGVVHPPRGQANDVVPIAGERQFEAQADHAVIVIGYAPADLPGAGDHRAERGFHHRRPGELHVFRSGLAEEGFAARRRQVEDAPEFLQPDFLADVEQKQDREGSGQCRAMALQL